MRPMEKMETGRVLETSLFFITWSGPFARGRGAGSRNLRREVRISDTGVVGSVWTNCNVSAFSEPTLWTTLPIHNIKRIEPAVQMSR